MPNSTILEEATFNPRVRTYWLLSGAIIMAVIVITIPLIPFWFIFGRMITGKYIEHMGCVLTEKTLIVRKGIFNRIEKTIPLEKITDLALKQGPIMRKMELHALSIETAGSSGTASGGALVSLVGINDTIGFRDRVLEQRDRLTESAAPTPSQANVRRIDTDVLSDIRDTLLRIESSLTSPSE
jgi:putative membrane protein